MRGEAGGSARQVEDVRVLLSVAGAEIDEAYLRRWIEAPGLEEQLAAARETGTESP